MAGYPMPNYRLSNCCWCLSLKTGCKIIGGLTAFVCSLNLIINCQKLVEILENERSCMNNIDNMDNIKWSTVHHSYFKFCSNIKFVQLMRIIDIIIFVIGFNGSVLLIYGIKSRQPKLFLAWMVFSGMMIFSSFFSILIWHNMDIMTNVFTVIILSYSFEIVRSYQLRLHEEINGGCPVLAVAFPQEPDMRVFMPSQRAQGTFDSIKDEPPPYPGLPFVSSSASLESQPPPYWVVNPNYEGPATQSEPSTSASPQITGLQTSSSRTNFERNLSRDESQNTSAETVPLAMEREASGFSGVGLVDSPASSLPNEEISASSSNLETSSGLRDRPNSLLSIKDQASDGGSLMQSRLDAAIQEENHSLNGRMTGGALSPSKAFSQV